MNILDKLKNAEHTFTAWVAKEYAKLYAEEPKIEAIADTVFKYAIPAVQIIVGAEAGQPAAAIVGAVATEAQADLHAASALIMDFGPTPTATSIVAGVQSNLNALLTDGHITNATSVANVTKVVNTLGALVSALPAAVAATAPAPAAVAAASY
jgi:hypothetical protein